MLREHLDDATYALKKLSQCSLLYTGLTAVPVRLPQELAYLFKPVSGFLAAVVQTWDQGEAVLSHSATSAYANGLKCEKPA